MKLNQFARLTPDANTQLAELTAIGFVADVNQPLAAAAATAYRQLFPEAQTEAAKADALTAIAVTERQSLADFLAGNPTVITRAQFYAIALQLLGFAPDLPQAPGDFALSTPLDFMATTKLPAVATDLTTAADLYAALYLLLNTRTPQLVTYLDTLAARGFFRAFQTGKAQPEFAVFNGKVQPVFDATQAHREVVWIESDLDTDHDGKRDLLEATIIRPAETDAGLTVPVLFTANPYYQGTNDVDWITHTPSATLAVKTRSQTTTEITAQAEPKPDLLHRPVTAETKTAAVTSATPSSYALNDYFLARGFATVYSAGVGTKGSDGVRSTGGPSETASAVAVIEWLTGKRRAFTSRSGNTAITAWWSNGKVAMTGKSYLGTLAIAAATSGVPGLKTIIAESAISSWYDYYRENGLVVAPGGFQGEDADVLAVDTYSRQKSAGDFLRQKPTWEVALSAITRDQDREFGDYSAWWDARNYRNHLANITCDIVLTHGLNDWNVKPANAIRFWSGLSNLPIQKKLFLHQGQHVYVNNIRSLDFTDMMNLWLSWKLLDVPNGAAETLPNVVVQDNVTPETWHPYEDFGNADPAHDTRTLNLATTFTANGPATFEDHATALFTAAGETSDNYEAEIVKPTSRYDKSRLWLDLPAFDGSIILEGTPRIRLRLAVDAPTAIVSVRLVDVGEANRFTPVAAVVDPTGYPLGIGTQRAPILEFGAAKTASQSKLVSFGHCNAQNQANAWTSATVEPGVPFTLDFELQPTHLVLPPSRHLALIIHGADMAQTQRPTAVTTYTVDLADSTLTLPLRKA